MEADLRLEHHDRRKEFEYNRYIYFEDWNNDGSISEGSLDMTWASNGDWKVTSASIRDQSNNYLNAYENQYRSGSGYGNDTSLADFESQTGIDLSDFEFKVSNPNSTLLLQMLSSNRTNSTLGWIVEWTTKTCR